MNKHIFTPKQITRISILAALSSVLLMINIPLPLFPSFYKIDFSEIPCLMCGFALGPLSGVMCTIISHLLNLLLEGGSETAYIGELASLLMSSSFVLTTSFIYKKKHTKKGAIYSLSIGVIILSIVSVLVNYFVLLPSYEEIYQISINEIILAIPFKAFIVHNKLSFVLTYTLIFNIIKGTINSLIIVLIYKRISPLIKDIY